MELFSTQTYRIAPVTKQGFGERQKPTRAAEKSNTPSDKTDKTEKVRNNENKEAFEDSDLKLKERQELQQLKSRDREVRTHEAAHIAAGGSLIRGGANFKYQRGPDGVNYAVGGDVSIDISKSNDPKENLQKANTIRRAALAPANPSAKDHAVAAEASQMAAIARVEIARLGRLEQRDEDSTSEPTEADAAAGANRYQQLERETAESVHELSVYA